MTRKGRVPLRALFVGCPRSGTRTITQMLQEAGLDAAHESHATDAIVSCFLGDETFYTLAGHGRRAEYAPEFVFHVTRHPLSCIPSMDRQIGPHFWAWVDLATGIKQNDPLRAARFWLDWNDRCEEQADYRIGIERIREGWPLVAGLLGIDSHPSIPRVAQSDTRTLRWSDLGELEEPIRKKSIEYGYE